MEKRITVTPVMITLMCNKCNKGELKVTNSAQKTSLPPQYEHMCDNCGHVEWVIGKTYPFIEYEIVE